MKIGFCQKLALILALLLLPIMISNESLWLDECGTAAYSREPTINAFWHDLNHDLNGDCQMPLALFLGWLTAHTFGSQEWQLRAINVLWGLLALLGMYRAGKHLQLPWLPLLLAIQPFFWYYSNEARPYALELACGAWLLVGLTEFITSQGTGESWAWAFTTAAVVLAHATMLAPLPLIVVAIACAIIAFKHKWKIHRKALAILLGGILATIPVAIFYLSSLNRGAKGAQLWHVNLKFFAYVLYELTGMSGLGPSVDSIRELARAPHVHTEIIQRGYQFLLPAICSLVLLLVFIFGLRKWSTKSKGPVLFSLTLVLAATSLIFVIVGISIQKAFWARHFAPIVPFYVTLLGAAIAGILHKRKIPLALGAALLIELLIFSSLNIRFGPHHRKENYRDAANIARSALAEKKSVWWAASFVGAEYYHLAYSITAPETGKVFYPLLSDTSKLPPPDLIIYSRPDIFDADGRIQNIIRQNGYRKVESPNSFVIWSK